jgi:hypothetical protein
MDVEYYGLRTRRQQYDWIPANAGKCINGREAIWNYGYPSIMCMDDALHRSSFSFSYFSFVLVILAGVFWDAEKGGVVVFGGLEWHLAYLRL